MRFTLGAFASLEILLFVFCLKPCVIYIVKINLWILLIDDFDSIFNAFPESCKPGFRLEFRVKREQSGIAYDTMVKSGLVLRPEHASEWSLHRLGFD